MALEYFVEQADRSPRSGVANEPIYPGELINDAGTGVDVFTYADAVNHCGLARYDAQAFAREWERDEDTERRYVPTATDDERDRVQYQPFEDAAVVNVLTPEDNGTDPAPTIGHRTVVGVVDADGGTVSSASKFQGRVVEEGYTDDAATTYDRASGNFKAVGVAYRPALQNGDDVTEFDVPVRVELLAEPEESE
jgi:hypothetical protein